MTNLTDILGLADLQKRDAEARNERRKAIAKRAGLVAGALVLVAGALSWPYIDSYFKGRKFERASENIACLVEKDNLTSAYEEALVLQQRALREISASEREGTPVSKRTRAALDYAGTVIKVVKSTYSGENSVDAALIDSSDKALVVY
jgi:hypothetical protein